MVNIYLMSNNKVSTISMGFFVFCAKLLSIFANNTHRTETGAVKTALKLCTRASTRKKKKKQQK